eukprot:TRINITY_DN2927_c0_g1_i5.p1 TRINITY_DN2927_c0_g1~~TRINITY_DN2927_c0_g1_i5.p1  ORF type:complete len:211 (+),score=58.94 TRINITY_DN2927_c0_g1_i5:36-668(+)
MSFWMLFKFIIFGESAVGKTCLLLMFTEKGFNANHDLTIGAEFGAKMVTVNDRQIKLQIWDSAGQKSFRSVTKSYYRNSAAGLLVYDVTDRKSFEVLGDWLNDARTTNPNLVITLVGNKTDIPEGKAREVTEEEGEQFARENGLEFMETSAKNDHNVEEVFMLTVRKLVKGIDDGSICVVNNDAIKKGSQFTNNVVSVEDDPNVDTGCNC